MAVLGWPKAEDALVASTIVGVIDAIGNELVRAEATDEELFIIPKHLGKDVISTAQVNDLRESLGANLILSAVGSLSHGRFALILRLLDPNHSRPLRERSISISLEDQPSIPARAVSVAASLLNITGFRPDEKHSRSRTASPLAFQQYQAAEAEIVRDNDAGLEAAIEHYKKALDIDGRYANAFASLATAYCRLSSLHHLPAALSSARANAEAALSLDPVSVTAHRALALVFEQTGNDAAALTEYKKALSADPSDPRTLTWQRQLYTKLNQWDEAESAFSRAIRARPNRWFAHSELGNLFADQGKYLAALEECRAANLAAPKNTIPLNNIGTVLLQLGHVPEAISYLNKSLSANPNGAAAETMAAAYRSQARYEQAVSFARQATQLDDGDSTAWLKLGDCCSLYGARDEAMRAYTEAAKEQAAQLETDTEDGPGTMLLTLYTLKAQADGSAPELLRKADKLHTADIDSQLCRGRILALLNRRDEAIATLADCRRRGATEFQLRTSPDMGSLASDLRFKNLMS